MSSIHMRADLDRWVGWLEGGQGFDQEWRDLWWSSSFGDGHGTEQGIAE